MRFGIYLLGMGLLLASCPTAMALSDENRPEYQKEYDAYLRDLSVIAQYGKAPDNPDLNADLAKMNSNDKIMLTAPQKRASAEIILAQNEGAQIVNSVEIIRVPEEFREEYHEVYKEETKTISTQSLVEANKMLKKGIAENPQVLDIADHINPFRFLAEVPLSPIKGEKQQAAKVAENPMVDAYFNQFGRPYSGGNTAPSERRGTSSAHQKSSNEPQHPLGNLSLRNSMFVD